MFRYILACLLYVTVHEASITDLDASEMLVYYEPGSRKPFRLSTIENNLISSSSIKLQGVPVRRLGFRSNGCSCHELKCGCCLGMNLQQINFNREGCMNFTYDPEEFSITMDMFFNNENVYTNTLSARNPPPLCIPVAMPALPFLSVDFCAKLFDIHTPGQNLHMCFDFETRFQQATILVLHFDCMRMGSDGVSLLKPGQQGPSQTGSSTESQAGSDVYDEVTEIKYKNSTKVADNYLDY